MAVAVEASGNDESGLRREARGELSRRRRRRGRYISWPWSRIWAICLGNVSQVCAGTNQDALMLCFVHRSKSLGMPTSAPKMPREMLTVSTLDPSCVSILC